MLPRCVTCKHWSSELDKNGQGTCRNPINLTTPDLNRTHPTFGCVLHEPRRFKVAQLSLIPECGSPGITRPEIVTEAITQGHPELKLFPVSTNTHVVVFRTFLGLVQLTEG